MLVDGRGAALPPDGEYVRSAAAFVRKQPKLARCHWAFVATTTAAYGMLRMWSILLETAHFDANAFTDVNDALHWLGVAGE